MTKKEIIETVETTETVQETPKKRGRKPKTTKTETEKVLETYSDEEKVEKLTKKPQKKVTGGWNTDGLNTSDDYDTITCNMYIEIELLTDALGMMPADKDILSKYIASKAPNALTKTEEIELYGEEEVTDKQTTIWPKTKFFIDEETDHAVDVFLSI